ncbi:hypothetical protein [Curtobacterium sp. ISL-83]|uniref:hypothetical protein n=1 Tax=Curtobacterium sp. ISL-83 TaxID=2819145 RepID=UPI001BE5C260|nr:hypothetical protein [Curtobacterium sp. ISL-83]MBT2501098.1 hypothetical protein [Curtobacterium sp. ISL-83]
MLWGRRRARLTAAAAGVVAATLLFTGCSAHLDAGTSGSQLAERELSQLDGVQSVRGSGTNNLPFSGAVSVDIVARDGLPDSRLQTLTDDVGRWVVKHSGSGTTYSAHLEADGFGFSLRRRASENKRLLTVVDSLRKGGRWLGGSVTSDAPGGTNTARIDLAVKTPADLLTGWTTVRKAGSASGWKDVAVSASAWNTPPKDTELLRNADLSITDSVAGTKGTVGDPTPEVSAYQQVVAKHRVTDATVSPGRVHLHLADLADVADAAAVIKRVAPATDAVLDGGIITKEFPESDGSLSKGADYAEADRLAAIANHAGVTAISLRPDWVTVTANGPGNVAPIARALAAASPAAPVTSIDVGSNARAADGDVTAGLLVSGAPTLLVTSAQVGEQLRGYLPASSSLFPSRKAVTATVPDVGAVSALVRALKPLLPDGTSLSIALPGGSVGDSAHLTVHGGTLTIDPVRDGSTSSATTTALNTAGRDAWNS